MKKHFFAVFAAAMVFCIPLQVHAAFSDTVSVENHISTGDVRIELKEYAVKNGKEVAYSDPKTVLPGDVISKIPRITNYAQPCWVRAKISFQNSQKDLEGLDESLLEGIGTDWKKSGEYYYYTKVLKKKESVDLFTGVRIPSQWTEAHSGQKLEIEIRADAIQAANFKPDFQAMSPWRNQVIEECIHEKNGTATCKMEKISLSVQFNGAAHKLIAVPDDFFANFFAAMPGDILTDTITVSNTTGREAEIFFRTAIESQNEEQLELLEQLKLNISMKQETLYEGDLKAASLANGISLGTFSPGQTETLSFSITVPDSLKNAYALRDAAVKWIFTVKEEADSSKGEENLSENSYGTSPGGNSSAANYRTGSETASSVKTGDPSPVGILICYILLSAAVFPVSLKLRKRGEKK